MKNIIYSLLIIIFSTLTLSAQNETLRGDEAIERLKQTGRYDSLMQAVKDSRNENPSEVEPNIEDAIGQTAKLLSSDGATGDNFGASVAISGDTAIVGAVLDNVGGNFQGSAYIFVRNGTAWTEQAKLTAAGGAGFDFFGKSVSISGDTAIVGASQDDVGANADQGSAFVFVRSGATWTQQAQLTATSGAANDFFGYSVSISGETAIVGAYLDDVGANTDQGSAYIFVRSGTVWTQQAQVNGGGATGANFGSSVAISGDTAIVGAVLDNVGGNFQGSAYIFVRNGTIWLPQAQLTAPGGAGFDFFGNSVAISGDTVVIGANQDDVGANADQGSAFVFVRSGTVWTQQTQLNGTGGAAQDNFGYSVAISGDTAIVGAYLDDVGTSSDQGSAFVFVRSGTIWTQQPQLTASDGAADDLFGYSVAISGNYMILGANSDDIGANTNQGSAYVFVNNLVPTAANVAVGGRVTVGKIGLSRARVTLTDGSGETRSVTTSSFGYYRFDDVEAGATYIVSVNHKRYIFAPQVVSVVEDLTELNFLIELIE